MVPIDGSESPSSSISSAARRQRSRVASSDFTRALDTLSTSLTLDSMSSWLTILFAVGVFGQIAIFGAGLMEAVSYVPNWRDPAALKAYRTFARTRHPGHFYQAAAPATIALWLVALVGSLIGDGKPVNAAVALASIACAEVLTFLYFFPRNRRLFFQPDEAEPGPLSRAIVREWERVNVVRLLIQLPGIAAALLALANS